MILGAVSSVADALGSLQLRGMPCFAATVGAMWQSLQIVNTV